MENGRGVVAPVLFGDLGNPRLGEVDKSGKSNVWMLTCINEGSAVACGHCISLAEGTTSVELASRAEKPQGETGHEFEMLLREGKRKVDPLLQGSSDEGWAQDAASEQAQT